MGGVGEGWVSMGRSPKMGERLSISCEDTKRWDGDGLGESDWISISSVISRACCRVSCSSISGESGNGGSVAGLVSLGLDGLVFFLGLGGGAVGFTECRRMVCLACVNKKIEILKIEGGEGMPFRQTCPIRNEGILGNELHRKEPVGNF